jgi:hypothetical protein
MNQDAVIDDWATLDEFITRLPDPEQDMRFTVDNRSGCFVSWR